MLFGFVIISSLLINNFNQRIQDQYFSIPTPVHRENLSVYQTDEKAFYQPVDTSLLTPINTFKEIYAWSDYNQIPILVSNDNIFIAGYLHELDNSWGSGINVDVISADINTGKVNWQAVAGSAFLLKDSKRIYAEAPNNFGAAGIVAYDINSGNLAWETHFDYEYAVGIGHLTLTETEIKAETYNHDNQAIYTVDIETGEIKDVAKDTPRYARDEIVIYDGMKFEKQGYGVPDNVTVTNVDNGSIIWEYADEPVVSNIAVAGTTTYFLTENNRLIVLDTYTGEILGELAFAPRFSHDFDFVNTSIIVAADGDVVAVYFEDSKQLSIFRFTAIK
jgi:outer membrane protein assembly factor BamB